MKISKLTMGIIWGVFLILLLIGFLSSMGVAESIVLTPTTTAVMVISSGVVLIMEGIFEGELFKISNFKRLDVMITLIFGFLSIMYGGLSLMGNIPVLSSLLESLAPAIFLIDFIIITFEGIRNRAPAVPS